MRLSSCLTPLTNQMPQEKVLEIFKKAGFECVDYAYCERDDIEQILGCDNYLEIAHETKKMIEASGLICNQAHATFSPIYERNLYTSAEEKEYIYRSVEAAGIIGAPRIVVHACKPVLYDEHYEENIKFFRSLIPYCEEYGIGIGVETLHMKYRENGQLKVVWKTAEEYCKFIEDIGSPWFSACIDIGHTSGFGIAPESFINDMKGELLTCLHVQDTNYLHDNHTIPFLQRLNWNNIIKALSDINYKGDLTLEAPNFPRGIPTELVYSFVAFMAESGKYLINMFEKYQSEKLSLNEVDCK